MFNQTKVTSLVITVIALFFIVSCGVSKPAAVPIASQPQGQPVEVSPDNAGEDEVLPQTPLNLTEDTRLSSEVAPGLTIPEQTVGDRETAPVVENKVTSEKITELEANWESDTTPVVENKVIASEQLPEHLRWKPNAIPTQENETGARLIYGSNPTTLSHWEQKWLVPK